MEEILFIYLNKKKQGISFIMVKYVVYVYYVKFI